MESLKLWVSHIHLYDITTQPHVRHTVSASQTDEETLRFTQAHIAG